MNGFAYTKKETLLKIDKVSLKFGDKLILRDVNAEIQNIVRPDVTQGQIIGFLGPSGIGKTQLSRIIAGLQRPTSGSVQVDGSETHKGRVGMVAQNYLLFEWTTVLDNLMIAGEKGGWNLISAKEHAQFYIDTFELQDFLHMYPKQLSGGTRQRVAIAQQLMCSEHMLIMDEPFSGLDLIMKAKACKLIQQVSNLDEQNTIIVVTHDVTEAASIADTLWMMGYEKDANGAFLPGARFVKQYDEAALGFAWHDQLQQEPEFIEFVMSLKQEFATLKHFS